MLDLEEAFSDGERSLDRRAFLRCSLVIIGGAALGRIPVAGAAPSAELRGFRELSQIATGVAKLSDGLAREYLTALNAAPQLKLKPSRFLELAGYANGHGAKDLGALERSPALAAAGGRECLDAIVGAWWSGMVPIAGGDLRVVTFGDALVWREVHEFTTCQGATGSWAKPGRGLL